MDPALKHCMNVDITWEALVSRDNTGDATYADPVVLKCYIAAGKILNFGTEQEQVFAKSTVYFDETVTVKEGDKLTPPHDIARPVILRNSYYDLLTGLLDLVEVFVK